MEFDGILPCANEQIRILGLSIINDLLHQDNNKNSEIMYWATILFDTYMSNHEISQSLSNYELKLVATSCTYLAIRSSNTPHLFTSMRPKLAILFDKTYSEFHEEAETDLLNKLRGKSLEILVITNFRFKPISSIHFLPHVVEILQLAGIDLTRAKTFLEIIQIVPRYTSTMQFTYSIKAASAVLAVISFTQDSAPFRAAIAANAQFNEVHLNECLEATEEARRCVATINSRYADWELQQRNGRITSPPAAQMDIIYRLGGLDVEEICDKKLTKRDCTKNELALLKSNNMSLEHVLTAQERASSSEGGLEVTIIEPNNNQRAVRLAFTTRKFGYVLKRGWSNVVQERANQLDEGTRIRVYTFRVSGSLHFLIVRV